MEHSFFNFRIKESGMNTAERVTQGRLEKEVQG
jgi:hypothetical protein